MTQAAKNSDVALQDVVVDRHPAVVCVARQIIPLVQGVGYSIAERCVAGESGKCCRPASRHPPAFCQLIPHETSRPYCRRLVQFTHH